MLAFLGTLLFLPSLLIISHKHRLDSATWNISPKTMRIVDFSYGNILPTYLPTYLPSKCEPYMRVPWTGVDLRSSISCVALHFSSGLDMDAIKSTWTRSCAYTMTNEPGIVWDPQGD